MTLIATEDTRAAMLCDLASARLRSDRERMRELVKYVGDRWLWYVLGSGLEGQPRYQEDAELTRVLEGNGQRGTSERSEARSVAHSGIVEGTRG